MHVTELAPLDTHQVICLGLPSSDRYGCFRALEDFTHLIKCHVPPGEPDGKQAVHYVALTVISFQAHVESLPLHTKE